MEAHEGMTPEEFREILKLAEEGNAEAQFHAGTALRQGWGAERNGKEALAWFEKAAGNGNANAALAAGSMHFFGDCGARNSEKAHNWYQQALALGSTLVLPLVNELYISKALEEDNMKEAREQFKTRAKALDGQPLLYPVVYAWNLVEAFCHILQNLVAKELPEGVVPLHTHEKLQRTNYDTLVYFIKTGNPEIFQLVFEYVKNGDDPHFWAISFYGKKQGVNNEKFEKILKKFQGDFKYKTLPENYCLAYLKDMSPDDMLEERGFHELAKEVAKLYQAAARVQAALDEMAGKKM